MKTKSKIIGGFLLIALFNLPMLTSAQTFSQGDMIFDVFAGGPNVSKLFVGGDVSLNSGESEELTGMLPVGLRGEYMVSDKFGLGLEMTYASGKRVFNYDLSATANMDTWKHNKLRVLPTFNFHFLDNDVADLYFAMGVGFKTVNYSFESTDPSGTDLLDVPTGNISTKFTLGTRIFFTDNIGVNFAFGIGGPLVNGGLSVRI